MSCDVKHMIKLKSICEELRSGSQYTYKCIWSKYIDNRCFLEEEKTQDKFLHLQMSIALFSFTSIWKQNKWNCVVVLKCVNNFSFILMILLKFDFVQWNTVMSRRWAIRLIFIKDERKMILKDFLRFEMEKN